MTGYVVKHRDNLNFTFANIAPAFVHRPAGCNTLHEKYFLLAWDMKVVRFGASLLYRGPHSV